VKLGFGGSRHAAIAARLEAWVMHLGRKYRLAEYIVWMRRETYCLFGWALLATIILQILPSQFLSVPAPLLAVVGTAVAIVLAFKNQQCHARINEALSLWGQINSASTILANKLTTALAGADAAQSAPRLKAIYYRHFAWLTALRFFLREPKAWENTFEPGNAKYLAALPTPESQSALKDEIVKYLSDTEAQAVLAYRGDKEGLLLRAQYRAAGELKQNALVDDNVFVALIAAIDDLVRLQGSVKRIKSYPYARNYYSIALILVAAFVAIVPFGLFPYAHDLGKSTGTEFWTAWLNIPFAVFVGWIFVTLEKVGENSSNPFEGGPNDVPISFLSRRIEIEMRRMLGEQTDLKPIEPKYNILF
jgi:putative membrane protein